MKYKQFLDHPTVCINSLPLEVYNAIHSYLLVNYYKTHVYASWLVKQNTIPEHLEHEAYHINGSFRQCLTYKGQRLVNSTQRVSSCNIHVYYNLSMPSKHYVKPVIKGHSLV